MGYILANIGIKNHIRTVVLLQWLLVLYPVNKYIVHVIYFSNLHFFLNLSLNVQAIVKIVLKVRVIVYFDLTILQGRANSSKTVFGALRRLSKYINE